jgi:hydroxymethylpyrimidine pyrophosphatase-like HAD family hydrolase
MLALENPIRGVVIDIDGCLNSTALGQPLDLPVLADLQTLSLNRGGDPAVPALYLNTGRDLVYAQVFAQILGIPRYYVFEIGAALARVQGAKVDIVRSPLLTDEMVQQMRAFEADFLMGHPEFVEYLQPGKRYMITFIFEIGAHALVPCAAALDALIHERGLPFLVDVGHNFINVLFPGISKASGLDLLLAHEPGLSRGTLAGIGDSNSDWDFMGLCALSACPHNASQLLHKRCHYVATEAEARGTLEIVQTIIAANRDLMGGT